VLKEKRTSQKQRSIAQILKHFSVETIFHHGGGSSYLELIGLKEHVEIAAYVADYLSEKLEELWLKVKKEHNLGGMSSKNSFFLGIAKGYDEQKRTHIKERALIQANLKRALAMIYPSLASSRSFSLHDATSHSLGQTAGRSLNIHPGVHQKNQKFLQHKI
ncbi:MAG: hypothetical protein K9M13_04125, partial [Simkaniaceae bacterium]|nr:hypothetical protein [Simkaniaceae bacterium]